MTKQITAAFVLLGTLCAPCPLLADPPPEELGMRVYREPHTVGGNVPAIPNSQNESQGFMDFKDPKTGKVTRYLLKDGKWVPKDAARQASSSSSQASSSPANHD